MTSADASAKAAPRWRTPSRAEAFAGPPAPASGPEPEVDARFSVLLSGRGWAVVDKSGNIPCHPSGRYRRNTLETLLREAGFPEVHFATRLDRETSGCTLVATDAAAAGALGRALQSRRVRKTYLCFARGQWRETPGPDGFCAVRGWICPAGDETVRKYRKFVRGDPVSPPPLPPGAQEAATRFRVVPWRSLGLPDAGAALAEAAGFLALECVPETGRTHQIRATVRALGLEVVGDKLYGPDRSIYARMCEDAMLPEDRERLGMARQALHAWKIAFREPRPEQDRAAAEVEAVSPPGGMLRDFAAMLSRWRRAGRFRESPARRPAESTCSRTASSV
ncbi:MAG: RNA pseudouridine synthase [Kiritimatiellae bacterium]|nr:RNA pseudouridine synthase [Kiritimatiellia bacterium]